MKRWNVELCTSHAPWKVGFYDCGWWTVVSARDEVVANIPLSIVHDEANARLIASAPELLSALELVVADWERLSGRTLPPELVKAAIAKAKGLAI